LLVIIPFSPAKLHNNADVSKFFLIFLLRLKKVDRGTNKTRRLFLKTRRLFLINPRLLDETRRLSHSLSLGDANGDFAANTRTPYIIAIRRKHPALPTLPAPVEPF
ncbi:MAG: hypothetical protein IKQ58_05235, partial [Prevotella sp.]|nr:hypothetical protein [Prevotella sp.]